MSTPRPLPLPTTTPPRRATAAADPSPQAGLPPIQDGDVVMQEQVTTTLRQVVAPQRGQRGAVDATLQVTGGDIPLGIVHARATEYGPARSRTVSRPTAVDTPEKASMRAELERLTSDLRAADAAAQQATIAERYRVEQLAKVALHDQPRQHLEDLTIGQHWGDRATAQGTDRCHRHRVRQQQR